MRKLGAFLFLAFGLSTSLWAATYKVVQTYPDGSPKPGVASKLRFSIFKDSSTTPLVGDDLKVEHERKIHIFFLDSGFVSYLHDHPTEVTPGVWEIAFKLDEPGNYRTWVEFKPVDETKTQRPFFDTRVAHCESETLPDKPVSEAESLVAHDGPYRITLKFPSGEPIQHGMTEMTFVVEKDGVIIPGSELDNYLGSKMHVTAVSADKSEFVHSHPGHTVVAEAPLASDLDKDLTLKLHFMNTDYYGVFMQFVHAGTLRTAQLAIKVLPH